MGIKYIIYVSNTKDCYIFKDLGACTLPTGYGGTLKQCKKMLNGKKYILKKW